MGIGIGNDCVWPPSPPPVPPPSTPKPPVQTVQVQSVWVAAIQVFGDWDYEANQRVTHLLGVFREFASEAAALAAPEITSEEALAFCQLNPIGARYIQEYTETPYVTEYHHFGLYVHLIPACKDATSRYFLDESSVQRMQHQIGSDFPDDGDPHHYEV